RFSRDWSLDVCSSELTASPPTWPACAGRSTGRSRAIAPAARTPPPRRSRASAGTRPGTALPTGPGWRPAPARRAAVRDGRSRQPRRGGGDPAAERARQARLLVGRLRVVVGAAAGAGAVGSAAAAGGRQRRLGEGDPDPKSTRL